MASSNLPPLAASAAQSVLGVSVGQLRKLARSNLLSTTTTPGGHLRFDADDVLRLAKTPVVNLPVPGAVVFHVGPATPDTDAARGRSFAGFTEGAVARGQMTQAEEDDGWRGWWACDAGYSIGAAAVAGFIVRARRLDGVDASLHGYKRFALAPLEEDVASRLIGHRIAVPRGPVFTPL